MLETGIVRLRGAESQRETDIGARVRPGIIAEMMVVRLETPEQCDAGRMEERMQLFLDASTPAKIYMSDT